MDTVTKQLKLHVKEFMKHCSWEEVTVKEVWLGTKRRREAAMEMPRWATNVWTLVSMRNAFITVDENLFWTYRTDMLESVNDYYRWTSSR